jgi:hypothetical protein
MFLKGVSGSPLPKDEMHVRKGESTMKEVHIPIVDGKYRVLFPEKCVYCGAPKAVAMRRTASAGTSRRRRSVTFEVPYCAEHSRESKRNARVLTVGFVTVLLTSCCVLFGVTTSINRNPPTLLLVFLALIACGLAFAGRELFRRSMSRSVGSMADMSGGSLGLKIQLAGDEIAFSFANDGMAEEFARLNGVSVSQ